MFVSTELSTTVFYGGRVHSPTAPEATAIAVQDGRVAWLGEDRAARELFPQAHLVPLDGAFVAPGFVDAHVHLADAGLAFAARGLGGAVSRAEALRAYGADARRKAGELVWLGTWDESKWDVPEPPTTDELEAVAPGAMVYSPRVDVHSAAASAALRAAVPGLAQAKGFHPQAPLTGEAHHLVRAAAKALLSAQQRAAARQTALDHALARGVVEVHECAGPEISSKEDLAALLGAEHPVARVGYWGEAVETADQARELLAETGAAGLAGDLFVDGSLGSGTAWLSEPYLSTGGHGNAYLSPEAVEAHVRATTEAGVPAGFHVIGDAAMAAVVRAFGAVAADVGGPALARCGHRLEHAEMTTAEHARLLGQWGVAASMQPLFDALWGGPGGMYEGRLGAERASRLNDFAQLASAGVVLAFGSDAPVTDVDPWAWVRAAANHHRPESRISARAAFLAATRGGRRAAGSRDQFAGTLVPGAGATFAVWSVEGYAEAGPGRANSWSTDRRTHQAPLPDLSAGAPSCKMVVVDGDVAHAI
ncbi:MAG: amidohydrolase [Segniliparus sp.]|uniref:amidohydrolase n=1 Tax=Segniliparus sp. TaxID=2804064 RepID=UPI003F33E8B7